MTIPKYNEIMLPMLQNIVNQKSHSYENISEFLIKHFKLTDEDISKLTPKGNKRIFDNRVQWARFYLTKSGLMENSKRNSKITKEGTSFLKKHPDSFNRTTLLEIPQFAEYMKKA